VQEHLKEGMVVNIKGDLKYSLYNDNVQVKKEIKSIFLSNVDDSSKYKATFTQTLYLDKDSVGKLDRDKAVFPIYARVIDYTKMYKDKEVKQNIGFNKTFELAVDKVNPENTKKVLEKVFKVKKGITEITVEGDILEGQTIVNVKPEDIPEDIKMLIDTGYYTIEEYAKVAVGNDKEKRFIIKRPVMKLVGEEDKKKPKLMITEDKYSPEDFMFDFMLEEEEEEAELISEDTNEDNVEEEAEADENAWMAALEDNE
jgi:hypothetical protein